MTFDSYFSHEVPQVDPVDHWLDEALRAVSLPDGFWARMSTLVDAPRVAGADNIDHAGRGAPTRGLAGAATRGGASTRKSRPI